MPAVRIVVCERTGGWAAALRSELGPLADRIRETRSWTDLAEECARWPGSLAVLEVHPRNLEGACAAAVRLREPPTCSGWLAVGPRGMAACQPLLRELGAMGAAFSPRRTPQLGRLARRWLACAGAAGPVWLEEARAGLARLTEETACPRR